MVRSILINNITIMEKKEYKKPQVKVKAIDMEGMICNSDPDSISGGVGGDPINSGSVDAKKNSIWTSDDK